jgi:uncharacterized protein
MKDKAANDQVIMSVRKWFEQCVVNLNLCPFARVPYLKGLVRFTVCDSDDMVSAAKSVVFEVETLRVTPAEELETTLLVFSRCLEDFECFLDMLDFLNETLELNGLSEAFQLASFHPDYQFEGEDPSARSNYTNRSPYPIIHILRNESMSNGIAAYGQQRVDQIPSQNIERLKGLTEKEFTQLFLGKDHCDP